MNIASEPGDADSGVTKPSTRTASDSQVPSQPLPEAPGPTSIALKDMLAIAGSIVALVISIVGFFKDNLFRQHSLTISTTPVPLPPGDDHEAVDLLIVNGGKHTEVLYEARFLFSKAKDSGEGLVSAESIGPFVVEPGKALLQRLTAKLPAKDEFATAGISKGVPLHFFESVLIDTVSTDGKSRRPTFQYRLVETDYNTGFKSAVATSGFAMSGLHELL